MHFDTYFKTYISSRKDLLLSDDMVEADPLPKNTILKILRVMQIVLENCQNKSSFTGLEVSVCLCVTSCSLEDSSYNHPCFFYSHHVNLFLVFLSAF